MHIGLVHNSIIPPPDYGGVPRFMGYLSQGLISAGHKVTLFALKGSSLPGANVIEIDGFDPFDQKAAGFFAKAFQEQGLDLLHFMATPRFIPDYPYLVTIHGNAMNPKEKFLPYTNFVSKSHAENHSSDRFVLHGIPKSTVGLKDKSDYYIFLAKASWSVKNVRAAMHASVDRKEPLKILGGKGWSRGTIQYMGMVGDEQKADIIPAAKALLFPVNWHEPFGLAAIEAQAMGTPVIASDNGAMPEVIEHGKTGFLVKNYKEMLGAMDKLAEIKPEDCRRRVEDLFNVERMTNEYIALYKSAVAGDKWGDAPKPFSSGKKAHVIRKPGIRNFIRYKMKRKH